MTVFNETVSVCLPVGRLLVWFPIDWCIWANKANVCPAERLHASVLSLVDQEPQLCLVFTSLASERVDVSPLLEAVKPGAQRGASVLTAQTCSFGWMYIYIWTSILCWSAKCGHSKKTRARLEVERCGSQAINSVQKADIGPVLASRETETCVFVLIKKRTGPVLHD